MRRLERRMTAHSLLRISLAQLSRMTRLYACVTARLNSYAQCTAQLHAICMTALKALRISLAQLGRMTRL